MATQSFASRSRRSVERSPPIPTVTDMDRRHLLKAMAASGIALAGAPVLAACQPVPDDFGLADDPSYGPLLAPDANGLRLPAGFSSRVVATSNQLVPGTAYLWHSDPDGGACFGAADGGWIYVSNCESVLGGASMVRFAPDGRIVEARRLLSGTIANCAGGATPWGTWLSCEEYAIGRVWEVDPTGARGASVRSAMGQFKHEAAACDPHHKVVYLTEDESDGCLYRFRPTTWGDLSSGVLEVMVESGTTLSWAKVPTPSPGLLGTPTRKQVPTAKRFAGGEGACVDARGALFFTTKGDNRVWAYDPTRSRLEVVYDDSTSPTPELRGVDNITLNAAGVLFVAEDGGNLQIVAVGDGELASPVVELTGVSGSEITGPAFSPDGTRLYFSSQRNPGKTYEVSGPWRR